MANPEHVAIIKKGAKAIAEWLEANMPAGLNNDETNVMPPDISEAQPSDEDYSSYQELDCDLSESDPTDLDFKDPLLMDFDLSGADLRGLNLKDAVLIGANLYKANLSYANLSNADLSHADLRHAELSHADFSESKQDYANFRNATLVAADFSDAILRDTDFTGAYLLDANLSRADLCDANLTEAILQDANLYSALLHRADLSGADLSHASLIDAELNEADLTGTNLRKADFRMANLRSARLCNADLSFTDLSKTKGLDTIIHHGPNAVDVHTIINSQGKIPEAFLRGCGVPDAWITHIPSIIGAMQPIQFYSCFISYSHADKSFARRLHDTLQGRGVRCWLDEHQLLPGDDPHEQIDRGIRLWDKVLLCVSKDSLTSWWVDNEIATAFEKEQKLMKEREKKVLALIPLDIDGFLFSKDCPNAKQTQLKTRIAAKFKGWDKDNALFEREFDRLIKALQAGDTGREPPPPPRL